MVDFFNACCAQLVFSDGAQVEVAVRRQYGFARKAVEALSEVFRQFFADFVTCCADGRTDSGNDWRALAH